MSLLKECSLRENILSKLANVKSSQGNIKCIIQQKSYLKWLLENIEVPKCFYISEIGYS